MSEFQYVAFRAIDKPVSAANLQYMRQQSSRAEVTPRSFDNEYHYGDFRGDAVEMLFRGYDIHLHYANFGIRKLLIQLPRGLVDAAAIEPFLDDESLQYVEDKKGRGGVLCVEPYHEPGDLDELWDFDELIERLIPLRAEILNGDLRPLYLAHLAMSRDQNHDPAETHDAPVPAGLKTLSDAQRALAELYGLSDALIAAAAEGSPPLPTKDDSQSAHADWLRTLLPATKDAWLAQWMADPQATTRGDILAAFRKARNVPTWPTVRRDRTIADLLATAEEIRRDANRKSAEKAARDKAKRLAAMAADPAATLRKTERLVAMRSRDDYRQTAQLLAELREALAGTDRAGLAEEQAQKLKRENPTLRTLVSELRGQGFVPK